MKHKIVLVPFPFDDLSATKVRPALCLTDEVKPYGHIILAFVTSNVANAVNTDLVIDASDPDFQITGPKVSSAIRLHRLVTLSKSILQRRLGELSPSQISKIETRLRELFGL